MRPIIVGLDMIKIGRGLERFIPPVEFLHPTGEYKMGSHRIKRKSRDGRTCESQDSHHGWYECCT